MPPTPHPTRILVLATALRLCALASALAVAWMLVSAATDGYPLRAQLAESPLGILLFAASPFAFEACSRMVARGDPRSAPVTALSLIVFPIVTWRDSGNAAPFSHFQLLLLALLLYSWPALRAATPVRPDARR